MADSNAQGIMDLAREYMAREDPSSRLLGRVLASSHPMDIEKLIASLTPGTNAASSPSMYLSPGLEIRTHPFNLNAPGLVMRNAPNTALIGPNQPIDTYLHEAAHVQQNQASRHLAYTGNYSDMPAQTRSDRLTLLEDLTKLVKQHPELARNFADSDREIAANMQAAEGALPAGTNVFDVAPWKDIYNTAAKRRMFEQMMYPRSDKMFPSDYHFSEDDDLLTRIRKAAKKMGLF